MLIVRLTRFLNGRLSASQLGYDRRRYSDTVFNTRSSSSGATAEALTLCAQMIMGQVHRNYFVVKTVETIRMIARRPPRFDSRTDCDSSGRRGSRILEPVVHGVTVNVFKQPEE